MSTPRPASGWRNATRLPSAPGNAARGGSAGIPCRTDPRARASRSSTAKQTWWTPPPRFARNFATGESAEVGSRSSIRALPHRQKRRDDLLAGTTSRFALDEAERAVDRRAPSSIEAHGDADVVDLVGASWPAPPRGRLAGVADERVEEPAGRRVRILAPRRAPRAPPPRGRRARAPGPRRRAGSAPRGARAGASAPGPRDAARPRRTARGTRRGTRGPGRLGHARARRRRGLDDRRPPGARCVRERSSIIASSATARSAPSRSALLTTKTSAISRMPALIAWMSSPRPGTSTTAVVSAARTMSTSSWPTPTVSMRITSKPAASRTSTASLVARARPPSAPRVAIERMKTPGSV